MKTLQIAGTELEVSALCYGAGPFGPAVPLEETDRLYSAFRQAGGSFFDTAHCYAFWIKGGLGACERNLGKCIRRHGDSGKVVIATKGGHPDGGPEYRRPAFYLAPEVLASDIAESLDRLGASSIDLYFLHRDDSRVPVGEIVDTLNAEMARGRVRHVGASNWSTARIARANEYAAAHGLRGFAASQVQWNLAMPNAAAPISDLDTRHLTDEDTAWHTRSRLPVMAYSSTACGYFATGGTAAKQAFDNATSRARLDRARFLAAKLGCTVNQVALAYLMCQDFPVISIVGTRNLGHLNDAMGATGVEMSRDQLRWLREG